MVKKKPNVADEFKVKAMTDIEAKIKRFTERSVSLNNYSNYDDKFIAGVMFALKVLEGVSTKEWD